MSYDITRRHLLKMIGYTAGASVMYQAMSGLGFAATASQAIPLHLEGEPNGASVVILGAGVAGMIAAYELRKAGYKVKILEFQDRAGGRAHSIYGGENEVDTDNVVQECSFDKGLYMNVGPWRIPYHHQNILNYCKMFGVKLEPFIQINFNAYLHAQNGFDGKPKRYREVFNDFNGNLSELLAKAINADVLDDPVTKEDKEMLLESLKSIGALSKEYTYLKGAGRRGLDKPFTGGLSAPPEPGTPISLKDLVNSRIWQNMSSHFIYEFQQSMFEPIGGMEMIGKAFAKQLTGLFQYNAEVTEIKQFDNGVEIIYNDNAKGGQISNEKADWCVCTIPLPVLRKINMNVGEKMKEAIKNIDYMSVVKIGAQYKRRFWEQDEAIYGGITQTDLPNANIAYPCAIDGYFSDGKGILLNGYIAGENGVKFTNMSLSERMETSLDYVEQIHSQARKEYDFGYSTAWNKVPWALGGYSLWGEGDRAKYYKDLCSMDGRIVLAGEHASNIPNWLESSITSSLDAISRLHQKAMKA